jgi:hypothetical protein
MKRTLFSDGIAPTALRVGALLTLTAALVPPSGVDASSHREAPFLTRNPKVDGTDFYMFRSYEGGRDGYVTFIANYQPLQDAYGGPNYFSLDPEALYEIHVDNNGDATEDVTFQVRVQNQLASSNNGATLPIGPAGSEKNVSIPLINFGAISSSDQSKLNLHETYSLKIVRGNRRTGTAQDVLRTGTTNAVFSKPVDYVGNSTFGDKAGYDAYANQYIYEIDIPGCTPPASTKPRVFVGQRQEGFAVNLGTVFDLVGSPGSAAVVTGGTNRANRGDTVSNNLIAGANAIGGKNITSIALEVPISCLVQGGQTVLGGWTTASVRQARVINPQATYPRPSREGGAWAQVSRLGNPLVNEVVIGIKDKDRFNSSEPKSDAQFLDYVTHPVLPAYLELLFGSGAGTLAPSGASYPRNDLLAVFLTGVQATDTGGGTTGGTMVNVNKNGSTCEYLRLNTALAPTARGAQSSLGAAACFVNGALKLDNVTADGNADNDCDPAGFPNGRRPGDDVTDVALRVMMGYLLPKNVTTNPAQDIPFTDFAINYDTQFGASFPYLNTPNPGRP